MSAIITHNKQIRTSITTVTLTIRKGVSLYLTLGTRFLKPKPEVAPADASHEV